MTSQSRRTFFKAVFSAGAALAASGTGSGASRAEASIKGQVQGICLFVPSLGKASEFVEMMNTNAPGSWTVHPLEGTVTEHYFTARRLYEEARSSVNTLVGVVDPATFAVIHEAIVDSGGSFHYVTYEDRNRVTFSVQI